MTASSLPFSSAWVLVCRCGLAVLLLSCGSLAQTPPPASLSGTVSNPATRRLLEGAAIELVGTGRATLTDAVGEFRFENLPPGTYTLQASYLGLEAQRIPVTVQAGERARRAVDLGSAIYQLDRFTVTGEREGNAAAITRQRNAESVKHVVSMDAFGNLANDNAGELLRRLPGISGLYDLDGNISEINIRGIPGNLNMVTVDGNLMASNFGDSRNFALRSISGALFDEIEVTKAPTPDMPADSIGGAINFKSASPLDMSGRRRVSFSTSLRWAPEWVENVPMAHERPLHPAAKVNWREVFGVAGGERNLGLTFNAFYSENASGGYTGTNAYENTLSRRAYLYDYQARDIYNNRKQKSASLKLDYRLSPATTFTFSALLNEDDQPYNYWYISRATTAQTLATLNAAGQPTGTGTILPNYTENLTQVRGLNNSQYILTSQLIGFNDLQLNLNAGAKHRFDRLELSYDAAYARSRAVLNTGEHGGGDGGGNFTASVRSVGWTIDRGANEDYPRWTQTEGPDISNPAVYIPGNMTRRDNRKTIANSSAKADAKYTLPLALAPVLKSGFSFRGQELRRSNADRRWNPVGAAPGTLASLVDLGHVQTSEEERLGRQIPFIDPAAIVADIRQTPARWSEDLYYGTTRTLIGNDRVTEEVYAAYAQGQIKLGRLKAMAGLRYEQTEVDSAGYVPAAVLSTTAQRNANPVAWGLADCSNYRRATGSYEHWFPGVYLTYQINPNLQARANWTNSIGRPGFTTLVPNFSVNDSTRVVNVNNPGLGPQTSENWDAGLAYYFEPVGLLSANVFRKQMSKFIVTGSAGTVRAGADNGFGGDYVGYDLQTTFNGGTATVEGYELAYQQRFEFLPAPWKGLSAFANYTWLRTEGDYGETDSAPRSTSDVLNFIPVSANAGLTYTWRGLTVRLMWNKVGRFLNTYNANPALLRYTRARNSHYDASVSYRLGKSYTVFVDVRNLTNLPTARWERAAGLVNAYYTFTSVYVGVRGEF
jgi:TonB-dependent receptor